MFTATYAAVVKRWAVAHPLWFCAAATCGWYALLLVHPLAALVVPVALIGIIGWWREAGLHWPRPNVRWWLVLPPLAAGIPHVGPVPFALALSAEVAARGLGQYALRRFGPWRVSVALAVLFGGADLWLVGGSPALAVAIGFCLTALRWRLNTVWPLVAVHGVLLGSLHAELRWQLVLAAGLTGYGWWLLRGYPLVRMESRPTVRVMCFDDQDRLLMICWHDPSDGTSAWDLPGGGIEPGETPFEAARREFREETGLPEDCVVDRHVPARRDAHWNNMRFVGVEPYFLARTSRDDHAGRVVREPHEAELIRCLRWVPVSAATALPGRVQLTTLADVAGQLITGSDSHRQPDDRCR